MNTHLYLSPVGTLYIIQCQQNNKAYIGKTTRTLDVRWNEHIRAAERGTRYPLYAAMRKYGIESFTIKPLAIIDDSLLDEAERRAIIEHNTHIDNEFGYNLTSGGEGTAGFKHVPGSRTGAKNAFFGRKHSATVREKIRRTLIERADRLGRKSTGRQRGPDGKVAQPLSRTEKGRRISMALKCLKRTWAPGTHPMLGRRHAPESIERMRQTHLGKRLPNEHKKKISQSMKGLKRGPQSAEHREKLRQTRLGRSNNAKGVMQLRQDGTIVARYNSVKQAAAGVSVTNVNLIRACCNGHRIIAYGFVWQWLTTVA